MLKDSTVLGAVALAGFLLVTSSAGGITVVHVAPSLPYETHSTETWIASASIFGEKSSSANPVVFLYLGIVTLLSYPSMKIASSRATQIMDLLRARKGRLLLIR